MVRPPASANLAGLRQPPRDQQPRSLARRATRALRLGLGVAPLGLVVLGCLGTLGCSSYAPPQVEEQLAGAPTGTLIFDDLETRAILMLLEDRRLFESVAVDSALEAGPSARRALALALGRIGDAQGREALERLLFDDSGNVRQAAAYSLGRLGHQASKPALRFALKDEEGDVARWAVRSLVRLEEPLAQIEEGLSELPARERYLRLLPSLFLVDDDRKIRLAEEALELEDDEVRRLAAYSVSRNALVLAVGLLRSLALDADEAVRAWALRGLGSVGSGEDLALLEHTISPSLGAESYGSSDDLLVQGLRAAGQLIGAGKAVAPPAWKTRILGLLLSDRPSVRMTAIEMLRHWLPDPEVASQLTQVFEQAAGTSRPRAAELALASLASGSPSTASSLVPSALGSSSRSLRVAGLRALTAMGRVSDLIVFAEDEDPWLRSEALLALSQAEPDNRLDWLQLALIDSDPAVRAMALEELESQPELPFEKVVKAMSGPGAGRLIEVRTAGVKALVSRGKTEVLERGAIVAQLEVLAADREFAIRRLASEGLEQLERPRPQSIAASTTKNLEWYREALARLAEAPLLEVATAQGSFRIELATNDAPLTCLSFLQLAGQGYFDGIAFHRVIPGFVAQAGDPRGDGWGGPGYTLRDETSPIAFERGIVGLALSGPDTGGSQFFVTFSRQPHLDGDYPVFGEVVEGLEVVDRLEQGDEILSVRAVVGPQ